MNLSIVIPVFNESKNIFDLLHELDKTKRKEDIYEAVIVDDGSTDDTTNYVHKAANEVTFDCQLLNSSSNNGQSTALCMGVKNASFEWVVTMDGDLQNNSSDIIRLLTLFESSYKGNNNILIAGCRTKRFDSPIKIYTSRVANYIRQGILKDNCIDSGCALRLFNRDYFLQLPLFNHMHRFLPALYKMSGGECDFVSIDHRPRTCGQSKYGTLDRLSAGVWDLLGVYWLRSRLITKDLYEDIK